MNSQPVLTHSDPDRGRLIADLQAAQPRFLEAYLQSAGLADLERSARWERIPSQIQGLLPEPTANFGLVGGFGIGKTCAMAALQRQAADALIVRAIAKLLENPEQDFLLREALKRGRIPWPPRHSWINWPTAIAAQRAKLFVRDQKQDVETWIQDKLLSPHVIVILDDLGAEHVTSQDWAGEVLARVIEERSRWQRPTVWTSNLDKAAVVGRYGARVFSRLQALSPPIELPKLPDLRRGAKK